MELLIFVLLAFLLPLLTVKSKPVEEEVLDYKTTTCIKGILCIFVMIHNLGLDYLPHLYPDKNYEGMIWVTDRIVEHIGGIAVGVFFFLSAYGLIKSYQKYGNKFLLKLIFKNVLKLWLVAVSINLLEYLVFFKGSFETKDAVLRILNLDFFNNYNRMNRHGWFIATLLALYLIFVVVFYITSLLKTKNKFKIACFIMAFIPIAFDIFTIIVDNGGMYSREIWGFSLGIIYALYYRQINSLVVKNFKFLLPLSIAVYIPTLIFQEEVATFCSCLFFVIMSNKYSMISNTSLFLGKISLGIYLFLHFSTLVLYDAFINNVYYWLLINAGFIFVFSVILYFIIHLIETCIKFISYRFKKRYE